MMIKKKINRFSYNSVIKTERMRMFILFLNGLKISIPGPVLPELKTQI